MATWSSSAARDSVPGVPGQEGPASEHEHVAEERHLGCHADPDPGPGRQPGGCHERLDHAADQQHQHETESDRGRAAALVRDRLDAGPRTGIDPGPEQPEPHPGGDEDRGELEEAVRQDQPEEQRTPVVLDHQRADHRDVHDVGQQQVHDRQPEHPEGDAQRGHPGVVGPHLRGEVRGGVLAVVPLEVDVDEPVGLRRGHQRRLDAGVLHQPDDHQPRHRDVDEQHGQPPAAHPVERRREGRGQEQARVAPRRGAGAGGPGPGPGQHAGEVGDQSRVRGGGAYDGQVGRDLLVAVDELVGLPTAQRPPPAELLEPLPAAGVRGHEGVDVHAITLGSAQQARRWIP